MSFRLAWSLLALSMAQAATFTEVGDAGLTPGAAQTAAHPTPGTPLDVILGTLDPDDADVFRILLTAGTSFSATTVSNNTNFFDTMLMLFDANGLGLVANDDDALSPPQSTIGFLPAVTGEYYLAIAGFGFFPESSGGSIFPVNGGFMDPGVVGPTGPGGASGLASWMGGSGEAGDYSIALTGAEMTSTPEPGSALLVAAALIAAGIYRKKENKREGKN